VKPPVSWNSNSQDTIVTVTVSFKTNRYRYNTKAVSGLVNACKTQQSPATQTIASQNQSTVTQAASEQNQLLSPHSQICNATATTARFKDPDPHLISILESLDPSPYPKLKYPKIYFLLLSSNKHTKNQAMDPIPQDIDVDPRDPDNNSQQPHQ